MGRRREKVFLGNYSIWWREEEEKISRWNCLSYTRHVTYLNLIGQTNASIKSVPGTSQPQRNITCVPRLDINYIMPRHNVRFFDALFLPILLYSSQVQGAYDRTDSKKWEKDPIEKIHTHFYKHFIGLNSRATNVISHNEAGRLSFKSNISIANPCLLHSSQLANNGKPSFMLSFHEIMNLDTVTLLLINYSSLVYSLESQN